MTMSSMSSQTSLPLYEKISCKSTLHRCLDITILSLLLTLVAYRLFSLRDHGFPWLLALLCESWFTFNWILIVSTKWNPVEYKPYPERLSKQVRELPPVDMFVTTADSVLEPPIITINTVLSLLAADYPSHKLACYVSDDGCSPLTFYSLLEASKFAKNWVPFCKKYHVQVRAPFRYFSSKSTTPSIHSSLEFQKEWKTMKEEYEQLNRKIEDAAQKSVPCDLIGAFSVFSNIDRRNHPSIIKVIWENKESGPSDAMPSLVYISREKRPEHPHHYKAGAMNVLTRVSGLMTNAPFMLNVDCDMFMNNPRIINSAMCLLLGTKNETESAFVMTPQTFYDGPKDDPFGNQLVVLHKYLVRGLVGLQGPFYGGTGCFHRRKVIYGLCPDEQFEGKLDERGFGNSEKFVVSAAHALDGKTDWARNLSDSVEAAHEVAGSQYDYGTKWGVNKVGWIYGSTTEDVLTGMMIHARGWKSVQIYVEPPAFLGCAPSGGPASMTQQKRWATGLLEVLLGVNSPIVGSFKGKLQFRQCLGYMWVMLWGPRSIPELCYAALPPYCIITNSHFLPKVQDPAVWIVGALFVIYNLSTLSEYLGSGLSIRAWWNNQRMARVTAMTAWLFGTLSAVLKILGLSETVFEITQKDQSSSSDGDGDGDDENKDVGRFTFDKSPIFVPGATILFINLSAMLVGLLGLRPPPANGDEGLGIGEVICSVWVVLCFWPFLKGLFGKGKFGIPLSTIFKSAALSLLFVTLCTTMS